MRGVRGFSVMACALVLVSAALATALAACGSDDTATEQRITRERRDAAHQARQEERLKELERELHQRQKSGGGGGGSNAGSNPTSSTPGKSCGGGLSVNSNASCPFAENVRRAYDDSGGSSRVEAYSPVTGQTYTMACSTGSPHVCTGGNNATIYFP